MYYCATVCNRRTVEEQPMYSYPQNFLCKSPLKSKIWRQFALLPVQYIAYNTKRMVRNAGDTRKVKKKSDTIFSIPSHNHVSNPTRTDYSLLPAISRGNASCTSSLSVELNIYRHFDRLLKQRYSHYYMWLSTPIGSICPPYRSPIAISTLS